jgi:sialic acid synthase SpsE
MNRKEFYQKFDFDGLIIFEMSKNHGGDARHALRIVRDFADVAKKGDVKGSVKLQFRNLDSYIHPQHREGGDERMQRYFTSHLSEDDFKEVVEEIKKHGLTSMSTPFDEESVDVIDRLGVEIIKIASSSARDWPLLERVVKSKKPIVCSTGGLKLSDIDGLVEFFKKHNANFALLHCVGIYPTPRGEGELNRIDIMRQRYSDVPIGFSSHENPEDYDLVKIAYAKGARLFEKHVATMNERFSNDPSFEKVLTYTATSDQMRKWVDSYKDAISICGVEGSDSYEPTEKEIKSIGSMVRGMYFRKEIKKGQKIEKSDVYFAIPLVDGGRHSGEFEEGMVAKKDYEKDEFVPISI